MAFSPIVGKLGFEPARREIHGSLGCVSIRVADWRLKTGPSRKSYGGPSLNFRVWQLIDFRVSGIEGQTFDEVLAAVEGHFLPCLGPVFRLSRRVPRKRSQPLAAPLARMSPSMLPYARAGSVRPDSKSDRKPEAPCGTSPTKRAIGCVRQWSMGPSFEYAARINCPSSPCSSAARGRRAINRWVSRPALPALLGAMSVVPDCGGRWRYGSPGWLGQAKLGDHSAGNRGFAKLPLGAGITSNGLVSNGKRW